MNMDSMSDGFFVGHRLKHPSGYSISEQGLLVGEKSFLVTLSILSFYPLDTHVSRWLEMSRLISWPLMNRSIYCIVYMPTDRLIYTDICH